MDMLEQYDRFFPLLKEGTGILDVGSGSGWTMFSRVYGVSAGEDSDDELIAEVGGNVIHGRRNREVGVSQDEYNKISVLKER